MEGWKSGKIENGAKIEKLENRKDFNIYIYIYIFFFGCEWKSGGMEKSKFV